MVWFAKLPVASFLTLTLTLTFSKRSNFDDFLFIGSGKVILKTMVWFAKLPVASFLTLTQTPKLHAYHIIGQ